MKRKSIALRILSLSIPVWLCGCAHQIPSCPPPEVQDKSYLPAPGYFRQHLSQIVKPQTWDQPFLPTPTSPIK